MHYFHRADTATDYARTASCRTTEVLAMPVYGDTIRLEADEDGYLNISRPEDAVPPGTGTAETDTTGTAETGTAETETTGTAGEEYGPGSTEPLLEEDDPFLESDLPLPSLATEKPEPPES